MYNLDDINSHSFKEAGRLNVEGFVNDMKKSFDEDWLQKSIGEENAILNKEEFEAFLSNTTVDSFESPEDAADFLKNCKPIFVKGKLEGVKKAVYVVPKVLIKEDTTIKKSHLGDTLINSGDINFEKKGKEIKERLEAFCVKAKAKMESLLNECNSICAEFNFNMTEPAYNYYAESHGIDIPAMFKFINMNNLNNAADQMEDRKHISVLDYVNDKVEHNKSDSVRSRAADCNRKMQVALNLYIDCQSSKLLIRNLKDDKNYKITPRQAQIMGF